MLVCWATPLMNGSGSGVVSWLIVVVLKIDVKYYADKKDKNLNKTKKVA